jgi:hypothetical protein
MPQAIVFDIGAENDRWLNASLFWAAGRFVETGRIEYAV